MMLVAWLEPLLYRTVALDAAGIPDHPSTTSETFRSVINSGSKVFFRDTVQYVFFRRDISHAVLKAILSTCSDIANLWMSPLGWDGNRTPLSRTGHLKLQRLHCNVENIFGTLNSIDFTHQLFANITHLQLFDPLGDRELDICLGLAQIPNLTHLSYRLRGPHVPPHIRTAPQNIWPWPREYRPIAERLKTEPRFLVMDFGEQLADNRQRADDWQRGAHFGVDYWTRVEALVAKRRSGEIDLLTGNPWPATRWFPVTNLWHPGAK
ncbi:hypothetical protein B0H11DRAFT_1903970 [Mycena galericulata]|nr:hypothetical protein B0H11DRAFT_1903970 [Mycena galericulata]